MTDSTIPPGQAVPPTARGLPPANPSALSGVTASSYPPPTLASSPPDPTERPASGLRKRPAWTAQPDDGGHDGQGVEAERLRAERRWLSVALPRIAFELENKGSVARDHLAGERTFLAWLRTSLALASIGIAITQLFRLPAASTSSTPTQTTVDPLATTETLRTALAPLISSYPELASLETILEAQRVQIQDAVAQIESSTRYRHLGKPIGGTLIALALVFLFIGIHRYFTIQSALMATPSMFPPSRRSVAFSGFCVGALVIAAFVAVLATK
ncbi:hypothetical protein JCM10212_006104 [Sporobolomyces blumeae]